MPSSSIIIPFRNLLSVLLFLPLVFSCRQDDPILPVPPVSGKGETAEVTLSVRIPDFRAANTRGVNDKGIAEITVLMFADEGGTEKVKVKHDIPGSSLHTLSGSSDTKYFSVPVIAGRYKRIALIANAQTELANITAGSTYDALKQVEVTGRFGQEGTGTYIPMYGEHAPAGGFELKAGVSQTITQEIPLIRMMARVDIINLPTSGALTVSGNKVSFVNPAGNGRVWVDPTTYNTTATQSGYMTPTLPAVLQPASNTFNWLSGSANSTSPNIITYYLNEQPASSTTLTTYNCNRPCIVINLFYGGREYAYRLDYTWDGIKGGVSPYEKGKYMPILRNHRYVFIIKEVKGPGFRTGEEAVNSPENFTNHNIVVVPIVIDEAFTDIAFNESGEFLAVSRTKMELPLKQTLASTDNKFELQTNCLTGWKISCVAADGISTIPDTGWMKVNTSAGYAGAKSTVSVLTQSFGDHEGFLIIQAGRLITRIRVKQNDFCGFGGNAKLLHIGNNDYLTHRYGTKCWMVQNSKEGTPVATTYPGQTSVGAYYSYTYSQQITENPCPSGWHVPTNDEAESMVSYAKANPYGTGKFWWGPLGLANHAFEGAQNAYGGWGTNGYWAINPTGIGIPGNNGGAAISSSATHLYTPKEQRNMDNATIMSVRCVRDSDY